MNIVYGEVEGRKNENMLYYKKDINITSKGNIRK